MPIEDYVIFTCLITQSLEHGLVRLQDRIFCLDLKNMHSQGKDRADLSALGAEGCVLRSAMINLDWNSRMATKVCSMLFAA